MLAQICAQVHKLPEIHNYSLLLTVNKSMSRSLEALRRVAAQNHAESLVSVPGFFTNNKTIRKIVKVLALIATMHLPAPLMSVCGKPFFLWISASK